MPTDRYSDGDREDLEWEEIFSGATDIRALKLPPTVEDHLNTSIDNTDAQPDTAFKPCEKPAAPSHPSNCLHGLAYCHADLSWCHML